MSLKQKTMKTSKARKVRRRRYVKVHAAKAYRAPDKRISAKHEKLVWDSFNLGTKYNRPV